MVLNRNLGEVFTARDLIVGQLLPRARAGLAAQDIDAADIDRYLGVIEERVESQQTGSQWALKSVAAMKEAPVDVRMRSLTAAMHSNQQSGEPVHKWPLAPLYRTRDWFPSYRTVGQFMTTEVFTVRPNDPVDLAARKSVAFELVGACLPFVEAQRELDAAGHAFRCTNGVDFIALTEHLPRLPAQLRVVAVYARPRLQTAQVFVRCQTKSAIVRTV